VTTVSGLAFEYVGDDQGYRITVEAMEFSAAGVTFSVYVTRSDSACPPRVMGAPVALHIPRDTSIEMGQRSGDVPCATAH
jgi:hypothetical protein